MAGPPRGGQRRAAESGPGRGPAILLNWARGVLGHYVVWDPSTLLVRADHAVGREAEVLKYSERRHVVALLVDAWPAMLVALLGPLALVRINHSTAELVVMVIIVVAQLKLLIALLEWSIGRIMVTNRRVIEFGGFLRRTGGSMPLGKMTDLAYEQSFLGLLLDYGMVRVESAGQNQALAHIRFLRYPVRFQHELVALGNSPSTGG